MSGGHTYILNSDTGHIYILNPGTDLRSRLFNYIWPFVTTIDESIEQHYRFEKKKKTRAHVAYYVCIVDIL